MISVEARINGTNQPAFLTLATESDILELKSWRETFRQDTTQQTTDIVEYTGDALKKWEYQQFYGRCPATWEEFLHKVRLSGEEVSGLFVLKAASVGDAILGFVFVRRTWTGNMALDYLAVRPKSDKHVKAHRVSATGGSLLVGVFEIGNLFDAPAIWWETSLESVGFYQKMLSFDYQSDRYQLSRDEYKAFLST